MSILEKIVFGKIVESYLAEQSIPYCGLSTTFSKAARGELLHNRLGHLGILQKSLPEVGKAGEFFCDTCAMTKTVKKPFPKSRTRFAKQVGDVIVHDWIPMPVKSVSKDTGYGLYRDEARLQEDSTFER